jgi:4-amino-4-deoxy-L-arabinose transferase-like glycosyltransferase
MLALVALAVTLLAGYGLRTRWGPALADEYIYLSGARHFARTGTLDARFYDARAILARGHPHQDVHSPGYVILLGALTALVRGGHGTAVGLNAAAFVAGALLVFAFARTLGLDDRAAGLAGALYLVLPGFLPFVFWAMPEVLLGTLFLGALVLAVRGGERTWAAVASGFVLGFGLLVRESLVFGLPAILAGLRDKRRRAAFLATIVLFVACVHVPLSRQRAPGGVNFWSTPADVRRPGGFAPWHAARDGEVGTWRRVVSNVSGPSAPNPTEKGILALFLALALVALARRRSGDRLADRVATALVLGWLALLLCMLVLFVLGRWSGFRYLMFLMPALLPWTARPRPGPRAARWILPAALALGCAALQVAVWRIHDAYRSSRQKRQEALTSYVERYVGSRPVGRIVLTGGFQFGWRHYPTEVISSLPAAGAELRALERAVWFDYLVLPSPSPLAADTAGRDGYVRVNAADAAAPLEIYRRLR